MYILFILVFAPQGITTSSTEFASEINCKVAMKGIVSSITNLQTAIGCFKK